MPAIERPTPDRLIEILRQSEQAGDILCGHAADEIERLRLTDAEREAVERLACACETSAFLRDPVMAATLRGLLERLAPRSAELRKIAGN